MSTPFDDLEALTTPRRGVAWLRFIEDTDGIRAALFQTTADGQPVDFCFTWAAYSQFPRPVPDAKEQAVGALLKKLLHAAPSPPTLILALSEEIPPSVFNESLRVRTPLCRFEASPDGMEGKTEGAGGDGLPALWLDAPPSAVSEAGELFDEVMAWEDPLEPFRRAAKGLDEAFADEHVAVLSSSPDLSAVVALQAIANGEALRDNHSTAVNDPSQWAGEASQRQLTLAQRLWVVRRAPPVRPRGVQLEWRGELVPFQREGVQVLLR